MRPLRPQQPPFPSAARIANDARTAANIQPVTTPSSARTFLRPLAAFAATTTHIPFSRKNRRRRKNCGEHPAGTHSFLRPAPFCALLRPLRPQQPPFLSAAKIADDARTAADIQPTTTHSSAPHLLRPLAAFAATTTPIPFSRKNRRRRKNCGGHPTDNHSLLHPAPFCALLRPLRPQQPPFPSAARIADDARTVADIQPATTPSSAPHLLRPLAAFAATTTHIPFSRKNRRRRKNCGEHPAGTHSFLRPAPFAPSCGLCGHNNPHSLQPQKSQTTQELQRTSNRHPLPPPPRTFCALLRPLRPQQPPFPSAARIADDARTAANIQPVPTPSSAPHLFAPSCGLCGQEDPASFRPQGTQGAGGRNPPDRTWLSWSYRGDVTTKIPTIGEATAFSARSNVSKCSGV